MKKYLTFKERIIDMETLVTFEAGRLYEVIYECDEYYQLANQNNMACGIERGCEGVMYDVIEKE